LKAEKIIWKLDNDRDLSQDEKRYVRTHLSKYVSRILHQKERENSEMNKYVHNKLLPKLTHNNELEP